MTTGILCAADNLRSTQGSQYTNDYSWSINRRGKS